MTKSSILLVKVQHDRRGTSVEKPSQKNKITLANKVKTVRTFWDAYTF